jgi:hypothetical protein
MKRSGFLKALGVMIAAPSVVRAIPTAAVRTASVQAAKENKAAEAKKPRGVFEIMEVDGVGEIVHLYVKPKGHIRCGDLLLHGYGNAALHLYVSMVTSAFHPEHDYIRVQNASPADFKQQDQYLYRMPNAIGESSI